MRCDAILCPALIATISFTFDSRFTQRKWNCFFLFVDLTPPMNGGKNRFFFFTHKPQLVGIIYTFLFRVYLMNNFSFCFINDLMNYASNKCGEKNLIKVCLSGWLGIEQHMKWSNVPTSWNEKSSIFTRRTQSPMQTIYDKTVQRAKRKSPIF